VQGQVEAGGVLLVTGANGSGKSTLLRCLAGLLQPEAGSVELRLGGRLVELAERRRRVGYVAPDLALYEDLTALENLRFFARLYRVAGSLPEALLERVRLPAERPWGALSSGMRQRLRWALAVLPKPPVLLLDEPFQNLDRESEQLVRTLLHEHLETGLAVVATPTTIDLPRIDGRVELAN
jgi:heme exporter protein A